MGYSERLKGYRIYFPGFKKIDISRDVTFDEDSAYIKSRKRPAEEYEEMEAPRIHDTTMNEEIQEEHREYKNSRTYRSTLGKESSEEETYLNMRSYPRCINIWGSRRNTQRKEKNQVMFQLCSLIM